MLEKLEFPFVHEDDCKGIFEPETPLSDAYFLKPEYKYFPDTDGLEDDEKEKYKFKNVKPGMYFIGLKVISEEWVNLGFCGSLLSQYGLVLAEANPIIKKGNHRWSPGIAMIELSFTHIHFK
jgi:hypothetical protein